MSFESKKWVVVLAAPARKSLERIPARDHARVRAAINEMEDDPFRGDIRKLKGDQVGFRKRTGNWRIFFDLNVEKHQVVVTAMERRTSSTY